MKIKLLAKTVDVLKGESSTEKKVRTLTSYYVENVG